MTRKPTKTPNGKPTIKYIVRLPFKYNGKVLQPGEEFIPAGSKNDTSLIEQGKFVAREESHIAPRRRPKGQ